MPKSSATKPKSNYDLDNLKGELDPQKSSLKPNNSPQKYPKNIQPIALMPARLASITAGEEQRIKYRVQQDLSKIIKPTQSTGIFRIVNSNVYDDIEKFDDKFYQLKTNLEQVIENNMTEKLNQINKDRQSLMDVYNIKYRPGTAMERQTFFSKRVS